MLKSHWGAGVGINRIKAKRRPSVIATAISADQSLTWTTYEPLSPNSRRMSSTGSKRKSGNRTEQGRALPGKQWIRQIRFYDLVLTLRRAVKVEKGATYCKPVRGIDLLCQSPFQPPTIRQVLIHLHHLPRPCKKRKPTVRERSCLSYCV